jgi:hypothetical protein
MVVNLIVILHKLFRKIVKYKFITLLHTTVYRWQGKGKGGKGTALPSLLMTVEEGEGHTPPHRQHNNE